MELAAYIHDQLKAAGHPVESVVLPVTGDRSTWRVIMLAGSTPQQQAAASAALAALAVDGATLASTEAAAKFDENKMLKALGIWTAQKLGVPLATARNEVIAIYKGL